MDSSDFSQAGGRPTNNDYSVRIDHRISDSHNIFGRVSWNRFKNQLVDDYGNAASPGSGLDNRINRSATLDDSYMLSDFILHANLGYSYHANPRSGPAETITAASLGLPAKIDAVAQAAIFPRIEPTGYGAMGGAPMFLIGNKFETYTATADVNKLRGSHTIKFGGTWRANKVSNFRPNAPAGYYTFNENWTRQAFNRAGGDAIAAMLLGLIQSRRIQYEPSLALMVPYYAVYFQDDWRVNSRLTLNLGLRWDSDRPITERFDRTSWFDTNAIFPVKTPEFPVLHGGLVFAGRDGTPRGNKDPDNNNFAPRLGLAYKITPRLVFRSGAGFFYLNYARNQTPGRQPRSVDAAQG